MAHPPADRPRRCDRGEGLMDIFGLGKLWSTLIAVAVVVAVLAGAGYAIHHWDAGRLTERYNDGRNDERHLWEEGQRLATERQRDRERADTAAAEAAGDAARSGAVQDDIAASSATQKDVNAI